MNTYIFIHGGESFSSHEEYMNWMSTTAVEWNIEPYAIREEKKKWKTELAKKLVEKGNLVYLPGFPNPQNAKYEEWKIFFDAWIKNISIQGNIVFIGTSLGGNFLLTYFGEKGYFQYPVEGIHLIASCLKCWEFPVTPNFEYLQQLGSRVHIWHAEDDTVVPFSIGQEIAENLPKAETHFFHAEKWYGHFHGIEQISELEDILIKK
jgi:uncharacterized protein